jgi:glutamate 5-kinase
MTIDQAKSFVQRHGVVLVSAKGPVPRLTEAIAGEPIAGSWWSHAKAHEIFAVLQAVAESGDVLVCRLVEGKVTLVHRRLWPALVRVAERFPKNDVAQVREEHTASGHHVNREVLFPKWVPVEVRERAKAMSEEQALAALGPWTALPDPKSRRPAAGTASRKRKSSARS